MSVQGWTPAKEVLNPRGMWSLTQQKRKGTVSRASFMLNQRIAPGVTRSRPGTAAIGPVTTGKVTCITNWITPGDNDNLVLYQDGTNVNRYRQADQSVSTLFTVPTNTQACVFADLDVWLYVAGYDKNGNGTFPVRVFDGTNADVAFRGPITITDAVATYSGFGQCTAGTHYIGFVYMDRTGYAGVPTNTVTIPVAPPTNTYPTATPPTFPVTKPLGTAALEGSYGTPVGGNPVHGVLNFAGWLGCQSNRVVGVLLYVDGQYCAQETYGGLRQDVADLHQALLDNPYTGFNGLFDVSTLTAGQHTWYSVAVLDDGRKLSLPSVTFTVSAGGQVPIQVVVGHDNSIIDVNVSIPALPDGGGSSKLYMIMTRADNPSNWYWIPDYTATGQIGEQPVPLNTPTTLHFRANTSDADMAASYDSANDQFNILSQDANGNGPFNPSYVVAYGQRMCYGNGTILYASDINNPQQIAADRNAVTMPNQRKIAFAFPLPGSMSLFLMGDRWTAYVNDNSDIPATWAQPVGISGTLGAPSPNCVCFKTGGNHAWIVTEGGVYRFGGVYDDLPVTYMVTDQWLRVNWTASYTVQITDNVAEHRVYVGVPLDGATDPNAMFTIDYTNGLQYDQVDISLDVFNPAPFTALGVVKEQATDVSNLWIGPIGPTQSGTYAFGVTATDATGAKSTVGCSIPVAAATHVPPPPVGPPTAATVFVTSTHIKSSTGVICFAAFSIGPQVVGGGARDFVYDNTEYANRTNSMVLSATDDLSTAEIWMREFGTLFQDTPTNDPVILRIHEVWGEATYADGSTWIWRPQSAVINNPNMSFGQILNPSLSIDGNSSTYAELQRWHYTSLSDYNIVTLVVSGFKLLAPKTVGTYRKTYDTQ